MNLPSHWPEAKKLNDDFLVAIKEFLHAKFVDGTIPIVRGFLGGWESWLQIEMALYFLHRFKADNAYTLERETTVWTGSALGESHGKCDLWLHPTAAAPPNSKAYVIELKTDIVRPGEPWKKIRDNFKIDVEKVHKGLIKPPTHQEIEEKERLAYQKHVDRAHKAGKPTPEKKPTPQKANDDITPWERARNCGGHRTFCIAITSYEQVVTDPDFEWGAIQNNGTAHYTYIAKPEGEKHGLIMIWYQEGVRSPKTDAMDEEETHEKTPGTISGSKRSDMETHKEGDEHSKVKKTAAGPNKPIMAHL